MCMCSANMDSGYNSAEFEQYFNSVYLLVKEQAKANPLVAEKAMEVSPWCMSLLVVW